MSSTTGSSTGSTTQAELLEAVRQFLREQVLPELDGYKAYNTRVAANALAIVAREMELGAQLSALDEQMAAVLGISAEPESVSRHIALGLRDGTVVIDHRLLRYLQQRTLLAVAIDNPKYSGLQQARSRWPQ